MQPAGSRRRARSGRRVCRTGSQPVIPSIVLLGNLLVDDVVLADGTTRMGQPGGALLYGALGATVWESRPGLVSVLGDDYPAQVLEQLQQRGVDLTGVHPLGPSRRAHLAALRRACSAPDSSVGVPDARRGVAAASTHPLRMERRSGISSRADAVRRAARTADGTSCPRTSVRLDRPSSAGHRGDASRVAGSPGARRRLPSWRR